MASTSSSSASAPSWPEENPQNLSSIESALVALAEEAKEKREIGHCRDTFDEFATCTYSTLQPKSAFPQAGDALTVLSSQAKIPVDLVADMLFGCDTILLADGIRKNFHTPQRVSEAAEDVFASRTQAYLVSFRRYLLSETNGEFLQTLKRGMEMFNDKSSRLRRKRSLFGGDHMEYMFNTFKSKFGLNSVQYDAYTVFDQLWREMEVYQGDGMSLLHFMRHLCVNAAMSPSCMLLATPYLYYLSATFLGMPIIPPTYVFENLSVGDVFNDSEIVGDPFWQRMDSDPKYANFLPGLKAYLNQHPGSNLFVALDNWLNEHSGGGVNLQIYVTFLNQLLCKYVMFHPQILVDSYPAKRTIRIRCQKGDDSEDKMSLVRRMTMKIRSLYTFFRNNSKNTDRANIRIVNLVGNQNAISGEHVLDDDTRKRLEQKPDVVTHRQEIELLNKKINGYTPEEVETNVQALNAFTLVKDRLADEERLLATALSKHRVAMFQTVLHGWSPSQEYLKQRIKHMEVLSSL